MQIFQLMYIRINISLGHNLVKELFDSAILLNKNNKFLFSLTESYKYSD